MKKKIDRLPAKVSQLGVRISMERNGARLISPSHIKFSGLMPASMLGERNQNLEVVYTTIVDLADLSTWVVSFGSMLKRAKSL